MAATANTTDTDAPPRRAPRNARALAAVPAAPEPAEAGADGGTGAQAGSRARTEIGGVLAMIGGGLLTAAMASFRPGQPNMIGPVGSFFADSILFMVGVSGFVLPLVLIAWGVAIVRDRRMLDSQAELVGYGLLALSLPALLHIGVQHDVLGHSPGGLVGVLWGGATLALFGTVGGVSICMTMLLVAGMLVTDFSLARVATRVVERHRRARERSRAARAAVRRGARDAHDDDAPSTTDIDLRVAATTDDAATNDDAAGTAAAGFFARTAAWLRSKRGASADAHDAAPAGRPSRMATIRPSTATFPVPASSRRGEPAWADDAPETGGDATADEDWSFSDALPARTSLSAEPAPALSARGSRRSAQNAGDESPGERAAAVDTAAHPVDAPAIAAPALRQRTRALGSPDASAPVRTRPAADSQLTERHDTMDVAARWRTAPAASPTATPTAPPPAPGAPPTARSAAAQHVAAQHGDSIDASDAIVDAIPAPPRPPAAPPAPASAASSTEPVIVESKALQQRKRAEELNRAQQVHLPLTDGTGSPWQFPPLSFLKYEESRAQVDRNRLREVAARLEQVLADFKVLGRVSGICPGPVVTLFEFEPESGTKLSKISGLSHDIAMALKAHTVRIIAPIPGKGCVGIEVPNDVRETVYAKEIIVDEVFARSRSKLTLALGKDIEGFPVVMDLAKSPHLLIAGTTGSGKSVSVNAMITSLLYNATPDEVKLILIDPKQLEFAIYEGTPHLLLPVVTDPSKAATALNWAVQDMERRYKLMADMKVRNLHGYNEKLEKLREENAGDDDAFPSPAAALLRLTDPDGRPTHRPMFQLVVIVDEFADLMMVAGKEVEVAVARLAQKARAAGIHVILATQRPSVDVITGLIKANFPTRISFRLMSGTDSRTVLDANGAESLLGMGDMLYRPPGRSDVQRVHGAYIDESEIEQVVKFLNAQRQPDFDESILATPSDDDGFDSDEPVDELYEQAIEAVMEAGFASISMIQRKLRIGYNRSARIVEEMERRGLVGPASGGSSRREILGGGMSSYV